MAADAPALRHTSRWNLVHRWLGLGLGLWSVMVGLSGAVLVWRDEIDAWLNPQWFVAAGPNGANGGAALDLEAVVERARGEQALGWVERIRPPREAGQALRLQVRAGPARVEAGRIEAFIDPAGGALLGVRSLDKLALDRAHGLRTLYELHRNILLGEPGSQFVGIAGLLLLGSAATGIVLAWPRSWARLKKLLGIQLRANAARLSLDVHRSSGVLIGTVLLLSTLTGATLVYLNPVRAAVSLVSRVQPIPVLPFQVSGRNDVALPLGELLARVQAGFPSHRVAEIRLPERGSSGVLFQLHTAGDVHRLGDTIVWVHPQSGALIAERSTRTRSSGEAFMHWLLPLHVGSAFGSTGLVLMAAAGSAPLLLLATGAWLWWAKRRKRVALQAEGMAAGSKAMRSAPE
jgi:uncharacterized iron-regulated membrane protein